MTLPKAVAYQNQMAKLIVQNVLVSSHSDNVKLVLNPFLVSKKSCTCLQFYTLQGLILGTDGTRLISFEGWHWRDDCFLCSTCVGILCDYGLVTSSDATAIICSDCNERKTKPKSILKKPQQNQSQGCSSGVIDSGIEVLEENTERAQPVQQSKLIWLIQVNDSDMCDTLSNAMFGLLFLGILACLGLVLTMSFDPEIMGFEVDERYQRIINDDITIDDFQLDLGIKPTP